LNSKLLFSILAITISILSFKSKYKKLFDLKLETATAIAIYYFGFSELIFQFRIFLIESKTGHFNFESENWRCNSEILKLNSKTYFILK